MILEILSAFQIAHTQPKVEIIWGKSNEQIRQEQEVKDRGTSYTGGEAIKLYDDHTNNCVEWAKKQTGITRTLGAGGRSAIQGTEPKVGAIGSLKGNIPHAVVVVAILDDSVVVQESNYYKNWITTRNIKKEQFLGYIYY